MRALWILAALLFAGGAWFVVSGRARRVALAFEILDELRRPGSQSWLVRATSTPLESSLELASACGPLAVDLYRPRAGGSRVPVLLVPGLVQEGKAEPRVAPFARLLARAGFTVLVPDLPSFRRLRVDPDQPRELAAAVAAAVERRDLAPEGRAGLFAISYAGGISLLVASDPALAARVPFVAIVGGFADLDTTLSFLATGRVFVRGKLRHVRPGAYGQMVFVRTFEEFLDSPRDIATLEAMIAGRMADPAAPVAELAAQLSPQASVLPQLFEPGVDPARVPGLIASLPAGLRARIAAMSPARAGFEALRARLYLVHARDDGTFPVSEAYGIADMAARAPDRSRGWAKPRLLVMEGLQHVRPEPWHRDPFGFLARDVPEAMRLAAWWYALLGERSPAP